MNNLTKPEIQFLMSEIKCLISDIEAQKYRVSYCAGQHWNKCDKETNKDSDNYSSLKYYLTKKNKYKQQQKKLSAIQGKLKKLTQSSMING